jgi:hypothetical protein
MIVESGSGVLFQLSVQGGHSDAELLGRFGAVATGGAKRGRNVLAFDLGQRPKVARRRTDGRRRTHFRRQIVDVKTI